MAQWLKHQTTNSLTLEHYSNRDNLSLSNFHKFSPHFSPQILYIPSSFVIWGNEKNSCIKSEHILREIWPEVNFKDYPNLKDYLTSIILKIISPQANSYKFQKVLRPQRWVGHKSWNMKFWNSLSRFCSCFWRASFSYEPIQPNKIFHLPRVLELFGSQQRIIITKVSYFGFSWNIFCWSFPFCFNGTSIVNDQTRYSL